VNPEGRIFLQDTEIPIEGLVTRLRAILENQPGGAPERRIFVRGDRSIAYGRVMEVMGTVSSAGFSRVALLAEQPSGRPRAGRRASPRGRRRARRRHRRIRAARTRAARTRAAKPGGGRRRRAHGHRAALSHAALGSTEGNASGPGSRPPQPRTRPSGCCC
jgi:hypothetical protein